MKDKIKEWFILILVTLIIGGCAMYMGYKNGKKNINNIRTVRMDK